MPKVASSVILASEALRAERINEADGDAEAILLKARATAEGIDAVSRSITNGAEGAKGAISLTVAEKYVDAFAKLAKESTAVVVPGNVGDISGMIATGLTVYGKVGEAQAKTMAKQIMHPSESSSSSSPSSIAAEGVTEENATDNRKDSIKETVLEEFNKAAAKK